MISPDLELDRAIKRERMDFDRSNKRDNDSPDSPNLSSAKKRSRKGLQKQFLCEEPGCGKTFTRLEHLARHRLNHNPVKIFHCTWEGCTRTFVREDLKNRHLERHERRKSTGGVIPKRSGNKTTIIHRQSEDSKIPVVLKNTDHRQTISITPKMDPGYPSPPQQYGFYATNTSHSRVSNLRNTANPRDLTTTPDLASKGLDMDLTPADRVRTSQPGFVVQSLENLTTSSIRSPDLVNILNGSPSMSQPDSTVIETTSVHSSDRFNDRTVAFHGPSQPSALMNGSSPGENAEPDLIQWLFSDAVLDNIKDPLMSPSFFESPMDLETLFSPPSILGDGLLSTETVSELIAYLPIQLPASEASSLSLFQVYINKYWEYFYPQYPLLHRPSFDPNNCPLGLLWTVILIGAAYDQAFEFSNAVCDQLRWAVFQAPEATAPTSLWVIQALLMIEIYEKTMSTRPLHERGHIHHAATIQMIRRGSALYEDTDWSDSDPWQKWARAEGTKRAALMAFILDVFDAALFGHPLMMSVHEIRLSLPCSESFWSEYPSEKSTLPGPSNQSFLSSLKRTLNKKHVDTGPFGRRALLAGLICISLGMQHRDLQVSSVGWNAFKHTWREILSPAFDFWKKDHDLSLMKSSENQSQNTSDVPEAALDDKLPTNLNSYSFLLSTQGCTSPFFHLSHILLSTSIMDFQIFAGSPVSFNRPVRKSDYDSAAKKIKELLHKTNGMQSLWHAIRFLREMFLASRKELFSRSNSIQTPAHEYSMCSCRYPVTKSTVVSRIGSPIPTPSNSTDSDDARVKRQSDTEETYLEAGETGSLQDMVLIEYDTMKDPISKRPHVLYVCAIVVWAFMYADAGPEQDILGFKKPQVSEGATRDEIAQAWDSMVENVPSREDGYEYLYRLSLYPVSQLTKIPDKQNLVGLLRLVRSALRNQTWELVGEGRRLINHLIMRSLGSQEVVCDYMFNPRARR